MKKKLILKKPKKQGSISAKIAEQQKKEKKGEPDSDQKTEPPPPPRKKKEASAAEKPSPKNEPPKVEASPVNEVKMSLPEPGIAQRRVTLGKRQQKGSKNKLREEILKHEEHKKFFIKQKTQKNEPVDVQQKRSSIPKEIKITEYTQVGGLAKKLNIKTSELIAKLMQMGEMVTITQSIDADTATLVAEEYGCKVEVVSLYDETLIVDKEDNAQNLQTRPPVVTVMGHVDHGKTKLLDNIRKTDIVSGEAGGITQHIGAYQVKAAKGSITFLDTPGHAAFTAMRARGALLTDVVVLVVAADDGVMPQTIEALQHARDAGVPIIVAVNKIDLAEANSEKVKKALSAHDLVPEDWGGNTPFIEISALKGTNLDKLKELLTAQAEMLELKANVNRDAIGVTLEARLDPGRGPVGTILIQKGTLKMGDSFVVGMEGGKVRAMFNSRGEKIKEAGPSTPVEILGLSGVPRAGDPFHVMTSEKAMKDIVEKRQDLNRQEQAQKIKKVKLENFDEVIQEGKLKQLKVIIKSDVRGSAEAIEASLEELSNQEVNVSIVLTGTGEISESDIMLASTSNSVIIAFNVRANAKVKAIADKEGIQIYYFKIIYEVVDTIKEAIEGMLSPDIQEETLGEAEVRDLFKISSVGTIAGCMVSSGNIKRNSQIRVIREGLLVYEGLLKTLKRFKDDVNEVKEGYECGILIDNFNDVKVGDILECFTNKEVRKKLEEVRTKEKPEKEEADKEKPEKDEKGDARE